MIIPVGPTGRQELVKVTKQNGHYEQLSLGLVSFVPLVHGKSE
jgi:protein-L-isoaspartate O-methyltransferase